MPSPVSLDEILAIDGNRPVYERLRELLAGGSAMALVGAGASFPLYPLWEQLIEALADEPVRRGLAVEADRQQWLRTAAQKPLHVAGRIRDRLKDPLYHALLFETFKDRTGADGRCYTPAHAAIVRAGFKAVITTNYDGGLVEARRLLRPEIRDTGFAVWNQDFAVNRWASGDAFRDGPPCPILFAHGHHADPPGIVLDSGSYHHAYHDTPYRRLFENLWIQEHLVFVGFSFSDVVLAQIADEVLWSTARQGGGEPRHVAILGLDEEHEYSPEMRHEFLDPFDAQVVFYPVRRDEHGRPDHSALQVLLDSLSAAPGAGDRTAVPTPAPSVARAPDGATGQAPPVRFVHESTDDEQFTGRDRVLQRLDDWAAEPGVRLVGITGIGGLGKTALLGHWLRRDAAAPPRGAEGIFFWSYYRDGDTGAMLRALLDFGAEDLKWKPSGSLAKASPVEQATALLGQRRLVVALDGLEVVQESPGTVAYGKLLAADLSDLLHLHGRIADPAVAGDASLVVLTSRFPFPDLTPYLGSSLRSLPLPELEPAEGSALLAALGVAGEEADRQEVSRSLSGHPLALRLFARSMPPDLGGDPTRLWQQVFDPPPWTPTTPWSARCNGCWASTSDGCPGRSAWRWVCWPCSACPWASRPWPHCGNSAGQIRRPTHCAGSWTACTARTSPADDFNSPASV